MKIIMIYDQIQSGAGIKDDHDIPLGAKKEAVGPAVMMEPFLKKVDGKVVACLYCGDGTYLKNPDEVSRKLCAMVNKLKPDVVIDAIIAKKNLGKKLSPKKDLAVIIKIPTVPIQAIKKVLHLIIQILNQIAIKIHLLKQLRPCQMIIKKRLTNIKINYVLLKHLKRVV